MQQTRSNGARQRVNRDPDRRPSSPPPGFWPLPEHTPLTVCGRCSAPIPDTDRARRGHLLFHEQVDSHDPR
jgi:hypothetical protein